MGAARRSALERPDRLCEVGLNRCFTDAGWPGEPYPQKLWVEHVEALYGLLDRVARSIPGSPSSPARAVAAGSTSASMARTDQVWTSDNTDPLDRLAIQHGFSQIHPARMMAAGSRTVRTRAQRSDQLAALPVRERHGRGLGSAVTWPTGARRSSSRRGSGWTSTRRSGRSCSAGTSTGCGLRRVRASAVQYVHGDETVVLALLQAQRHGEPVAPLRLRGLDPSAAYECRETGEVHRGAVLLHHGLRTGLRGDFDAAVIRLRRM